MKRKINDSQSNDDDINLPSQDIKTEPGQPTFKKALQAVLAKPRKRPQNSGQNK